MTHPGNDGIPQHAATYDVVGHDDVEPKTKASTGGAAAGAIVSAFVVWLLDETVWNGAAAPEVPFPVTAFVGLVIGAGLTFAGGYFAKHVNRPNPPA
jgi:hypothetical protein